MQNGIHIRVRSRIRTLPHNPTVRENRGPRVPDHATEPEGHRRLPSTLINPNLNLYIGMNGNHTALQAVSIGWES